METARMESEAQRKKRAQYHRHSASASRGSNGSSVAAAATTLTKPAELSERLRATESSKSHKCSAPSPLKAANFGMQLRSAKSAVPALRCWVNVPDATGTTLLMCAVKHGLTDIVQLLLADTIAADPNASDAECKTALHWATEASDVGSARALLAAGADKNAKDSGGNTALLVAARNASVSVELVTVLLQAGSNANAVNGEEDTALLLAVRQCRWSTAVVEALLTGGADAGAKGKDGRTAHKIARRAGNLALARMLLDYSAPTVDGDGEMCVICLVCVPSDDHATTPCGHHYHHTCLARWTLEQATCPMCKAALPDDSDGGEDEEELSYDMEARRWHIAETS